MDRPEFVLPEFLENSDPEDIQERMMGQLPPDISDMDGDFPYDFTMPTAIEISQMLQFSLVRTLMLCFPEYAWDDWMDLHAREAGVSRRLATYAEGYIRINAEAGVMIPQGTVFAVPATDISEAIEYETKEDVAFVETESKDIPVVAVEAGIGGNVAADTVTIMSSPIKGINEITNPDPITGGYAEESDDELYERIYAQNKDAQFYVGNDADYIKWAKEVDGIGDCIVDGAWDGPGTVKLILVDSNGVPASNQLVQKVYDHIVSPDDRSRRILPTGSAQLTIVPAAVKSINYKCTGMILNGITIDAAIAAFKAAVAKVYSDAKLNNILRYNDLRPVLANIEGIEDFEDFQVNNSHSNIPLSKAEYAATGTVSFTE